MSILKSVLAGTLAGGAALAISATASAATNVSATPTPAATLPPTGGGTATPAGPLTIKLICDTGTGSGTFTVTASGKSSTVSISCGKSATVTNGAWQAGSTATIHQTKATASGQLRAADVKVTLKASGETVTIRNFRAASATTTTATLAQTGGGLPVLPIGLGLLGLLLAGMGGRLLIRRV